MKMKKIVGLGENFPNARRRSRRSRSAQPCIRFHEQGRLICDGRMILHGELVPIWACDNRTHWPCSDTGTAHPHARRASRAPGRESAFQNQTAHCRWGNCDPACGIPCDRSCRGSARWRIGRWAGTSSRNRSGIPNVIPTYKSKKKRVGEKTRENTKKCISKIEKLAYRVLRPAACACD